MIRRVLVFLALAVCHAPTVAADDDRRFEITPFAGYRFGGTFEIEESNASYEIEDSSSLGLILNLREKANTQWELTYSTQSSEAKLVSGTGTQPFVDLDTHVLQLGGTYQGQGEKVRPYLAVTVGGTRIETDADSDTFFSGSIGVGVQVSPSSRLGLRLEARGYGTLTDSNTDLFCRTGPDLNVCAARVEGTLLKQFETFAGVVFRF